MTRFGWPLAAIGVLSLVAAGAIAQVDEPAKTAPAKTAPAKTAPAETEPAETGPAEPLYQQEPYDLITLNAANNSEVLKVEPLRRPVSKTHRPSEKIEVRLWNDPAKTYELRWSAVEKVETFEELILAKAVELVQAGSREEAYDYFEFLQTKHPDLPGLKPAVDDYLYHEAGLNLKAQQHFAALAMLRWLHERNPQYPNLQQALDMTNEKLIEEYVAKDDFASTRILVEKLAAQFSNDPVAAKWEADLKARAGKLLEEARGALAEGKFREADKACQGVARIWPRLPGVDETLALVRKKYTRVLVGVGASAVVYQPARRDDWASRRASRLLYRTLTEFTGPGSEGGKYRCPVGTVEIDTLGASMTLQLRPGVTWSRGDATLTGADVARRLLVMTDPADPAYRAGWASLFAGVAVDDVYRVTVRLQRPHVRPDALWQTTLPPYTDAQLADEPQPTNGPYLVDSRGDDGAVYILAKRYFAATPTQPKEIVERVFTNDREAIRALRDGQINVVDRLNPWTLSDYRSVEGLTVERYAMPLVHCLIPNQNKPLLARRTFRRALVYGINRARILSHLLGGKTVPGCDVLSGPFPQGESYDDPVGYAYDAEIKVRPYEPRLALALAGVAVDSVAAAEAKKAAEAEASGAKPESKDAAPKSQEVKADAKDANSAPKTGQDGSAEKTEDTTRLSVKLTLAHPPTEIARGVCGQIKEQLKLIGIDVTLKELPPGPIDRVPEDVDLLYAELAMWEPLVDAREVLGAGGLAGSASAYMSLALRQLEHASDWRQIRPRLRQIHRIAYNDVTVIPLFQLVDHFAYRKGLQGLSGNPVSLYENVEQWQIIPQTPAEAK